MVRCPSYVAGAGAGAGAGAELNTAVPQRLALSAACARAAFASQASSLARSAANLAAALKLARQVSIKFMNALASLGVKVPAAQAERTAPEALARSPALSIGGRSNLTGRSRRTGKRRVRQKRIAAGSPARAFAIALRISSSAASSTMASSASRALLRDPFGRPRRRRPKGGAGNAPGPAGIVPAARSRSFMSSAPARFVASGGCPARK